MSTSADVKAKKAMALKFLMTLFVVGVVIVTVFVFTVSYFFGYEVLVQKISSAKTIFALWRMFVFIVFVGAWDYWIERLSNWMQLSDAKKTFYLNYRWRFALWLLVIETLLIQDVLADFFSLFIN
ncbi:MAG: hypothetical protein KAI17_02510 [Thiotrichaceae bacterium]|nr:hypothetical protein [Thiotrichaceae bacterium]